MKQKYPDASRVWQRVLPQEPREQQSLQMLLRQLSLDCAYLKRLGKSGLLLQEYTDQQSCLKGILFLTGSSLPRDGGSPADHSLSRCYDHALQRLAAYQLRSSDPVYGPVFRDLAHQTEHHCRLIAELLGSR